MLLWRRTITVWVSNFLVNISSSLVLSTDILCEPIIQENSKTFHFIILFLFFDISCSVSFFLDSLFFVGISSECFGMFRFFLGMFWICSFFFRENLLEFRFVEFLRILRQCNISNILGFFCLLES